MSLFRIFYAALVNEGRFSPKFFPFLLFLIAGTSLVFAHGDEQHPDENVSAIINGTEACLSMDSGRDRCYASLCPEGPSYLCAEEILTAITMDRGPETSMQVLAELVESPLFDFNVANEGHSLAHIIGRTTSTHFGGGGEAFLRCPTSFDSGCQHGFLEDALVKTPSVAEAVTAICQSLPEVPSIDRPNCYHGSGHGVMMNERYNLSSSLAVCNMVPGSVSCWTGVFMENVNGHNTQRIQNLYPENNRFKPDNPLAPCDELENPYKEYCYKQHMPYLAKYSHYNVTAVVDSCISASESAHDCASGFGAYSIFDGIQSGFLPDHEGNFIEKTIHLCNQFPEDYREACYTPAIDQISIFYGVERTSEFCEKIEYKYKRNCFRTIGRRLTNLVMNDQEIVKACSSVPAEYRNECLLLPEEPASDTFFSETVEAVPEEKKINESFDPSVPTFSSFIFWILDSLSEPFITLVSAHPDEEESDRNPYNRSSYDDSYADRDFKEGIKRCLSLNARDSCFASLCNDPGYLCAEDVVDAVTALEGPETGVKVLQEILSSSSFSLDQNGHQLAHIIGRSTALNWGGGGDAFNRCPVDFSWGCVHGFFEEAVLHVESPVEAMLAICKASNKSSFEHFNKANCFHGLGHGVMMGESHNLYKSLSICEMLEDKESRKLCLSGVFMENILGFLRGETPEEFNTFKADDPLAPCNVIEDKYKPLCYIYHEDYLVATYSTSLKDLTELCFDAGEYVEACLKSFIRIITAGEQYLIVEGTFPDLDGDSIEKAVFLCNQYPEEYVYMCHMSAADHLTYPDAKDSLTFAVQKVSRYCSLIEEAQRRDCFMRSFLRLNRYASEKSQRAELCEIVPETYRNDCLNGPNVDPADNEPRSVDNEFVPVRAAEDSVNFSYPNDTISEKNPDDMAEERRQHETGSSLFENLKMSFTRLFRLFTSFILFDESSNVTENSGEQVAQGRNSDTKFSSSFQDSGTESSVKTQLRTLTPDRDSEKLLYDDAFMDETIKAYDLRSITNP